MLPVQVLGTFLFDIYVGLGLGPNPRNNSLASLAVLVLLQGTVLVLLQFLVGPVLKHNVQVGLSKWR